jgi:hypothetical protein
MFLSVCVVSDVFMTYELFTIIFNHRKIQSSVVIVIVHLSFVRVVAVNVVYSIAFVKIIYQPFTSVFNF